MSYPPDPNNPYAQPQKDQQPGYGYPQQGQQQPGYGYPQQGGGLPQYGGAAEQGYPAGGGYGMPMQMPGGVKAARVMLFVTGGLSAVGAVLAFLGAAALGSLDPNSPELQNNPDFEMVQGWGAGIIALVGVLFLAFAVGGIVLGAKFGKGGNGLRIGTIVYGALTIVMGIVMIPLGLLFMILAVLIVVFVAKGDGSQWFNRPRY